MKTFEGNLVAQNMKVALVAARFNEFITSKLIGGAMDGLTRHGVQEEDISLAWVPGAFEIPLIASKMAASGKYDAVICLGAVGQHQPLRLRLRGGVQGDRPGLSPEPGPGALWGAHHRHH